MYRIEQYRPNLRKNSYGLVKTSQWSEKNNDAGIFYALDNIDYRGRFALNEEITELSITHYRGKIGAIWIKCSRPQYKWDKGFNSFMVHFRPKKVTTEYIMNREEIDNEELKKFLVGAKKYFEENDLNVKILDEMEETSIEEIISSY